MNRVSWPLSQALAEHSSASNASAVARPPSRAAVDVTSPSGSAAAAPRALRAVVAPRVLRFSPVESVGTRWQAWPAAAMIVLAAGLWFARSPHAPFVGPPIAPAAVTATATASASMPAITLHLSADASGTAAPRRVRLSPDTSRLRIEVALPSDVPSPVDITVHNADGRVLWSTRRLAAGRSLVTVSIPADALAKGLLSLTVTASDGSRPARRTAFFLE